jgi:hypothetical protein
MTTFAQIIEREFRNAVNDQDLPVQVEFDSANELITVNYKCASYTCACDSDDEFIFLCREDDRIVIRFPTPQDWYDLAEKEG